MGIQLDSPEEVITFPLIDSTPDGPEDKPTPGPVPVYPFSHALKPKRVYFIYISQRLCRKKRSVHLVYLNSSQEPPPGQTSTTRETSSLPMRRYASFDSPYGKYSLSIHLPPKKREKEKLAV